MAGPAALRIGLTGGIGSGKSTVAAALAALGASVIDTDAIARSLTVPGGAAIAAIAAQFGAAFVDASGALGSSGGAKPFGAGPGASSPAGPTDSATDSGGAFGLANPKGRSMDAEAVGTRPFGAA